MRERPPGEGSRLVLLDGVEDPQNVGALARVAESAGAHGLILTERRAPPLTPAVSRASAGAIEWLRVARVSNLGRALSTLQQNDYWVVAAAPASKATTKACKSTRARPPKRPSWARINTSSCSRNA